MAFNEREAAQQLEEAHHMVENYRVALSKAIEENEYLIGVLNGLQLQHTRQAAHRRQGAHASGGSRGAKASSNAVLTTVEKGCNVVLGGELLESHSEEEDGSPHPRGRNPRNAAAAAQHGSLATTTGTCAAASSSAQHQHHDPFRRAMSTTTAHGNGFGRTASEARSKQSWRFFYSNEKDRDRFGAYGRIKDLELEVRAANEQIAKYEKVEKQLKTEHEHVTRVLSARLNAAERGMLSAKQREDELAAEVRALKQECDTLEARLRRQQQQQQQSAVPGAHGGGPVIRKSVAASAIQPSRNGS